MTLHEYAVVVPCGEEQADEAGRFAVEAWKETVDAMPGVSVPEPGELRLQLGRLTWPDGDVTESTFHGDQEGPGMPAVWVCGWVEVDERRQAEGQVAETGGE